MKRYVTNKAAMKNEVQELLTKEAPKKEVKSIDIILGYNGKFKIDRYTLNLDGKYDEYNGFSLDTISEKEARRIYQEPGSYLMLFLDENNVRPKWLKKGAEGMIDITVTNTDLDTVKRFFSHEYKSIPPMATMQSGGNYYDFIRTDPHTIWFHSDERKLWTDVTNIWKRYLKKLEEENS